jgi:hypothetical protein
VYQAGWSGRPKLPRQFVSVRHFEPRLFVPMTGNMGRPAFTFVNLYIFCNLQRIINKNIHHGYVCIYFLIRNSFVCLFVGKLTKIENVGQRFEKIAASVPCVIPYMNVNTCHLNSTLLNSFVQYFTAR